MSYKNVFFDIDGTLINDEARIPDAKESIYKLKERNIEVCFTTGRAPSHFKHIAKNEGLNLL